MEIVKEYISKGNVVTIAILAILVAGFVKVISGDLTLDGLIDLNKVSLIGLAAGAGFARVRWDKAAESRNGAPVLDLVTVVILGYVLLGTAQVCFGDLTYEGLLDTVNPLLGALAVGRGIAAGNAHPPGKV